MPYKHFTVLKQALHNGGSPGRSQDCQSIIAATIETLEYSWNIVLKGRCILHWAPSLRGLARDFGNRYWQSGLRYSTYPTPQNWTTVSIWQILTCRVRHEAVPFSAGIPSCVIRHGASRVASIRIRTGTAAQGKCHGSGLEARSNSKGYRHGMG